MALLRRARALAPQDGLTRKNLSGVLTDWGRQLERQGRIDQAVAVLQEAAEHDPTNGMAWLLLGDVLYLKRNDLPRALTSWKRAHGKVPQAVWPAVANRIAQAERDQLLERHFASRTTAHFTIRFHELVAAHGEHLERLLEAAYARLAGQFGTGPKQLTVLIYSEQDLQRVYYRQRDWALGFYDGRIRLALPELGHADLEDLIAHELAHAFLHDQYGESLPIWVHEGYAQLQERAHELSREEARIQEGLTSRSLWLPLKWLDRHFEQPSSQEDIARAYAQARMVIKNLVTHYGMERFKIFLTALSHGTEVKTAYDMAFAPSRWLKADQGIFD